MDNALTDLVKTHDPVDAPCGAVPDAGASVCFRVWAPHAHKVELLLWDGPAGSATVGPADEPRRIVMEREPKDHFAYHAEHVAEEQRYAFSLDDGPIRPDPASRWQPDGLHRPSAVIRLDRFDWCEGDWHGIRRSDLVLYELHVGTFTQEGTFDALVTRMADLCELGVTAVELMPVCQFPGGRSWGYDLAHPFAVQNTYGGPRGLQRLVAAAHRAGLAVFVDVVYNHFGPEGNYLGDFGPYFTDRYNTPWGRAINFDDRGCDAVRALVLDNVRMWIRDYHVDGLRIDAVHAVYDFSACHILKDIKQVAEEESRRLGRPVHLIAESDLNDVQVLDPHDKGGYGIDAQWSDDFHHAVHALLTGERTSYYSDFGRPEQVAKALNQHFVYDGVYSPFRGRRHGSSAGSHAPDRFVNAIQNHDQIGNRARGDRLGTILDAAQQRLAAGLLLLAPQIPLIFMGEEYDETRPFPYFCSLEDEQIADAARRGRRREFQHENGEDDVPDPQAVETFRSAKLSWSWMGDVRKAGLRQLYRRLLCLRRKRLSSAKSRWHEATLVEHEGPRGPILRLVRTMSCQGSDCQLVAFFNLDDQPRPLPEPVRPGACLLLKSEESQFGGNRGRSDSDDIMLPYEFCVFGPSGWSEA